MNTKTAVTLVLFLLFRPEMIKGQNLCPNPGFEQLSGCPTANGEIALAAPWSDAGSPSDLFSFCHVNGGVPGCSDVSVPVNFAGVSAAHGGSAYAGFYTRKSIANERTYIQAPLTAPLGSGQLYRITAYFKRSTASRYATNRIGIVFSTGALSQTSGQFIPLTPQAELANVVADTGNWTPLTSYYTGTGLEDQIAIGNFRNDAATTAFNFSVPAPSCAAMNDAAFYYVDDISVTPVTEILSITGDTLICTGETTTLTGITNTTGWWSLQTVPADTLVSVNNSISVNPSSTTTYLWNGVQSSYSVTVSVSSPPLVVLPDDTTVCEGTSVLLDATNPNATYAWSNGEVTPTVSVADSGLYVVTVTNEYCAASDTFRLSVIPVPALDLGDFASLCPDNNETVELDAGAGDAYYWYPGGETTQSIVVAQAGFYSVQVTHGSGCVNSDTVEIREVCRETLFIPGAFTPNRDLKNDLFYADGSNIQKYSIRIFNRWGQEVFASGSLGITGAWNGDYEGQPASAGLYTYLIDYDFFQPNGKTKKERKAGTFVLVR